MFTEKTRQTEQSEGILQGEILRLLPLGQRRTFGLGVLITHLAPLHVRAVLTEEQVDQIPRFRILTDGFGAVGLLFEDQFGLLFIQISRSDLPGQGGLDQLFLTVVADPFGLQVGAEAADANHGGQALQIDGAGCTGVNVPFPLLHLVFQALITLVEALQVRQPLHLAVGDLIEGVLHPSGEAGVHQFREMLLEQRRHSKGGEAGGQGVAQQRGVAAIHDRSNDRGVGRRPADALLFQHLHQRCLAEPCRRLGLMAKGLNGLRLRCIANAQRRQQHFLTLKGRIGIITAFHVGAEETGEVDALAAGPETGLA